MNERIYNVIILALITLSVWIMAVKINSIKNQVEELRNDQIRTEVIRQAGNDLRESHKITFITDSLTDEQGR